MKRIPGWLPLLAGLLPVAGCTTLPVPLQANLASPSPAIRECADWFVALDKATERAGVRDAGAARVPGYPYLRADRFLASFRGVVAQDARQFHTWVDRLQALDADGRRVELRNLSPEDIASLGAADAEGALATAARCAEQLRYADLHDAAQHRALAQRVRAPDAYLDWQRALGFYALTRIPFGLGVARWQEAVRAMFRQTRSGARTNRAVIRYVPPAAPLAADAAAMAIARATSDALGIPELSAADRDLLFAAHAPVFEVEHDGPYDLPGALMWRDEASPAVDTTRPVVYRRLAYTRFHGETLVQLVYAVWFSGRPHDSPFDLLAGRLDGVVWRVTLGSDGVPLVYDTMHPCGCFHMFFPTRRMRALPAPDPDEEWAFMPATLPEVPAGRRLGLRIATRTHYLVDVAVDAGTAGRHYQFEEDAGLRTLPYPDGGTRSAFGPDGIVPGTERGERFLFWPMGVPSAGAMRQWGNHATAFLGRRHFDDADLIERRFQLRVP